MPPAPTERLVFRTWRDDDLPLALALFGDPRVTEKVGGPFDATQVRDRLALEIAIERDHGYQYWPMFDAAIFVGCCGLKPPASHRPGIEMGFYIVVDQWGRGYATEGAGSVIAFAFDQLGETSLFAGHHPENTSSQRALDKLGFRYLRHELYPPTGLQHPGYELKKNQAQPQMPPA